MDKFKLVIWVLVIAGMILKPYLKRRKERMEALKRTSASRTPAPTEPESAEEPETQEGPSLPYEDLVEEVFGDYISRRRKEARPVPPPPPPSRPAPSRVSAPAFSPAAEPPRADVSAPVAVAPTLTAEPRPGGGSVHAEASARRRSLEEHLFGRRRLSSSAKLIIAAEILSPPRILRARGRSLGR